MQVTRESLKRESCEATLGLKAAAMANPAAHKRRPSGDDGSSEESPLLSPIQTDDTVPEYEHHLNGDHDQEWTPHQSQKSKSSWYMLLLTLGGLGLQMGWSVEMSNGSPYLLSLGLSKAMLALVWIAGPLSGVIVQPFVGLKSDRSRIQWGKRRPYMVGGAVATILSLLVLAWTREIVSGVGSLFGFDPASDGVAIAIMSFAVVFIYVLDFAINVCTYNTLRTVLVLKADSTFSPGRLARIHSRLRARPPAGYC